MHDADARMCDVFGADVTAQVSQYHYNSFTMSNLDDHGDVISEFGEIEQQIQAKEQSESLESFLDLVDEYEQDEHYRDENNNQEFNWELFQQNSHDTIQTDGYQNILETACGEFDAGDITELQNLSRVYQHNSANTQCADISTLPTHDLLAQTLAQFDSVGQNNYATAKVVDIIDLTAEDESSKDEDISNLFHQDAHFPNTATEKYLQPTNFPNPSNFYLPAVPGFSDNQTRNYPGSPIQQQNYLPVNEQQYFQNLQTNYCDENSTIGNLPYLGKLVKDALRWLDIYLDITGYHLVHTKLHVKTPMLNLMGQDLWLRFHKIGTEMIITKAGRRMFPSLRFNASGFERETSYVLAVDILPVDNMRYRYVYSNSQWMASGNVESVLPNRLYIHPESPATGEAWMRQVISFDKMKLTNNESNVKGHMILHSMRKYQPRIHLIKFRQNLIENLLMTQQIGPEVEDVTTFIFPETGFTTVTAYQNQQITKLKIERNPFAKGFRDTNKTTQGQSSTTITQEESNHCPENYWIE